MRPFNWFSLLDEAKYDCLEHGLENDHFHCAVDNKHVRENVFNIISTNLDSIYIDSLIVEKRKTGPALRADERFYPEMLGHLLKYVLCRQPSMEAQEIIIITDTVPVNKKRRSIEKAVKTTLSKMLPTGQKYRILHHSSRSHYGLQLADYCCWAVARKHERGETRHFDMIKKSVRSEFDIFKKGKNYYY